MEFPPGAVSGSDTSEPGSHSQGKVIPSNIESYHLEECEPNISCTDCGLPEGFPEVQDLCVADPDADVEVCGSSCTGDSCELPEKFSGEKLVSDLATDNLNAPESNLPSSAHSDTSISGSVPVAHCNLTPTTDQVPAVSNCSDEPKDMKLDSSVSEDVIQVQDTIARQFTPVDFVQGSNALSFEQMLLVGSDELNSEEMPLTDDIESDAATDAVEVTVDVNERAVPLHVDGNEEESSSLAHAAEIREPPSSPAECIVDEFCSPKSFALKCKTNECDGEEVSCNFSDETVMSNTKNCSPLNTPGNENTSAIDSCFNLLLPPSPDSPPILDDILIPTLSSLHLPRVSNEDAPVAVLAPAEWCQYCDVLAPTDPDKLLPNENCVENVRDVLEHLPGCRYYKESGGTPCSEAVFDAVTSPVAESRSDTEANNSKAGEPCTSGPISSDSVFDFASAKSCEGDGNSAEDEMVNSQLCTEIDHDGSNELCDTETAELVEQVDVDEFESSFRNEGEVFKIEDLGATTDVTEASRSPVHNSAEVITNATQDLEDLSDGLEVAPDGGVSEMNALTTQNDSCSERLVAGETSSVCVTPEAQEENQPIIENINVSYDQLEGNCSPENSDHQMGKEASDGTIPPDETPPESVLDTEIETSRALGLESLGTDPDEDDFEESLPGNAMSLLPDNSYSLSSPSPNSFSNNVSCNVSDSLSDFSSTKCILRDSDSCGPSPEPTDGIDISCGISVLFEKCKNRRDLNILSCSSSKVDKTTRSMVATSENISSQLEKFSISDSSSHVSAALSCDEDSKKSDSAQGVSAQSSPLNFSVEVDMPTSNHLLSPERKIGVLLSPRNSPIVEETDDEVRQSAKTENSAKSLLFKLSHDKAQNFKNPCTEHVVTTSAPCSPVPQPHRASSMAGITSRKRKGNKCVRRRVSFPENDLQLITSYLEPVDPWERMKRSVNSDEVLRAYMTSCRSHGCQPMPIVTNQIAALPLNVPGRVECFSLRGCKLELSQCEGLEEIFKRVQFVCIDLENCSLSDDTVIPLLDMIEFYDSTTHLNISGNSNIGMRGWQACSRMLKKNQSVRSLNARGTNLNEVNMPILGKALKLGARLHTLHLENCNLTGRPLIMLTAALKLNDTVLKLYLADNRLGSNDCIQIGNLMKTNLTLKLLDLRNNNLQDVGCAHVCEGIAEQSKSKLLIEADAVTDKHDLKKWGLNSLVLWNNHMTVSSAKHLASMMLASTSIETLNVGRNSVSNDGAIRLKEALLRNKSLKRLYLHATKIGDEGAVALAELLAESKNIERVDLRENSIKVAGLMALAHSLRHNTSMVQMDLDSNPRSEPLEELAEKHVSLLLEIKEYTQRNRVEAQTQHTTADSKEADSEDYFLDPDFRKLSLSSEIDGSQTLEIPTTAPPPNRAVSIALGSGVVAEEHKRYRSPSPSPCASPVPSPSLSPVPPTPFKNRFKVFKVSSASSPTGSCIVTANPIYSGSSANALSSTAFSSLSSSAPSSSLPTPVISTTSRPVVHHPQPVGRNRFLSGGRFTVTKVSDTHMAQSNSIMKSKSLSLPQISLIETVKVTEPSSPKIVISSPAKIERGFSLEENSAEGKRPSTSIASQPCVSNENECAASATKIRTDSSESDDVFVDSTFCQSDVNSSLTSRADKNTAGAVLSPVTRSRRDLTDSGFLEETATDFEDALSSLPAGPSHDSDRDSLFSNTSDPDGHSPVTPLPPADSTEALPVSSNLPDLATATKNPPNSNSSEFLSSLPSRLGALFRGTDRNANSNSKIQSTPVIESKLLDRSSSCASEEVTCQPKRAPLASMENGSMDTDSEDSEVTTQSSDSTHSDEVRITSVEASVEPVQAWGGDEAGTISNSDGTNVSAKNIDPDTCGNEELSLDDETESEVKNNSEVDEQLTEGQDVV